MLRLDEAQQEGMGEEEIVKRKAQKREEVPISSEPQGLEKQAEFISYCRL